MLILKWLLSALVLVAVLVLVAGQFGLLRGRAPADLGVHEGRLKPPSRTPNSVSSQAALYPDNPRHADAQIAPLPFVGDAPATLARIEAIVAGMPGAQVVARQPGYLGVQFTTRWMKFVDDTEFWADPSAQAVQVRSASRLGSKDFGVNRARIEAIRARLGGQG
jgi:uncharacterized protein (DUF1499 family)